MLILDCLDSMTNGGKVIWIQTLAAVTFSPVIQPIHVITDSLAQTSFPRHMGWTVTVHITQLIRCDMYRMETCFLLLFLCYSLMERHGQILRLCSWESSTMNVRNQESNMSTRDTFLWHNSFWLTTAPVYTCAPCNVSCFTCTLIKQNVHNCNSDYLCRQVCLHMQIVCYVKIMEQPYLLQNILESPKYALLDWV